jgi:alkanesulfonate monooxygenase SsuD/methylene tetrahydromethanopterin reductase-like flavin-dependent oxidoreductase (luciferase family)
VRIGTAAGAPEGGIAGPPRDVAEQLRELAELGFNGFNLMPQHPGDVRVLGEEVLPALRA